MPTMRTLAVHAGRDDLAGLGVHVPPIDLSTTYPVPDLAAGGEALGALAAGDATAGSPVYARDFRGLRHLADRLGDDLIAGFVLYTGTDTLPFGPRFRAMRPE